MLAQLLPVAISLVLASLKGVAALTYQQSGYWDASGCDGAPFYMDIFPEANCGQRNITYNCSPYTPSNTTYYRTVICVEDTQVWTKSYYKSTDYVMMEQFNASTKDCGDYVEGRVFLANDSCVRMLNSTTYKSAIASVASDDSQTLQLYTDTACASTAGKSFSVEGSVVSAHSYFFSTESAGDGAPLWRDEVILGARVPREKVVIQRLISRGGYGEVYAGTFNGKPVAVKMLLPGTRKSKQHRISFLAEVKLMATLEHPRIVRFVGVAWDSPNDLCALLEFMAGGDLRALLDKYLKQDHPIGFNYVKVKIALHVAHALAYLHSLDPPVIHRDLKSKNILLSAELDAKLTDFGVSRERVDRTMTAAVGTSLWMSPEVMMGERYDDKADIFSFGVVLSELNTHAMPYSHAKARDGSGKRMPDTAILQLVSAGELRVDFSQGGPEALMRLGNACVAVDPKDRPSTPEVLYCLQTVMREMSASPLKFRPKVNAFLVAMAKTTIKTKTDDLFRWIEEHEEAVERTQKPWGRVLDAGTGRHSLQWLLRGDAASRITEVVAVTGEQPLADQLTREFAPSETPHATPLRVHAGNWQDDAFLGNESVFDVIIAGTGFAPYFQDQISARLEKLLAPGGRLYLVGLQPLSESASAAASPSEADQAAGRLIQEVARTRDACLLLGGRRCYREYPIDWTQRQLEKAGLPVTDSIRLANVYSRAAITRQLEVGRRHVPLFGDAALAESMQQALNRLDARLESTFGSADRPKQKQRRIRFGFDYVLAARKPSDH
ncbi:hypothetical protein BBJ28_00019773 [Nothophytophthora sp. Chile5]|nr:hypothetical protein BBJ28_00019773 [Nothophytophthora sp. Chile5]